MQFYSLEGIDVTKAVVMRSGQTTCTIYLLLET